MITTILYTKYMKKNTHSHYTIRKESIKKKKERKNWKKENGKVD